MVRMLSWERARWASWMGPTWGPTNHETKGMERSKWNHTRHEVWSQSHASNLWSMAQKFNGFIWKKFIVPRSNGPIHSDGCKTWESVVIMGVPCFVVHSDGSLGGPHKVVHTVIQWAPCSLDHHPSENEYIYMGDASMRVSLTLLWEIRWGPRGIFMCIIRWGTNSMGPTLGPTDHGTCGGLKETSWMSPYIKFGVNPMPLTPSFVTHKFNNFTLKEKIWPSIQ